MTENMVEPVVLERLRRDAVCIITRIGLGEFKLLGAAENILVPESYVAWATLQNELGNEGYCLVAPDAYAAACGLSSAEVQAQLHEQGTLFALSYGDFVVVALPEKTAILPEIAV
jgi:hypothetical protein